MNIQTLRIMSMVEGISAVLLFCVAMPLKYIWDNPVLIRPIGMAHGLLFLAFLVILLAVCHKQKLSLSIFVMGLIASIIPFAPFAFDLKLRQLQQHQR